MLVTRRVQGLILNSCRLNSFFDCFLMIVLSFFFHTSSVYLFVLVLHNRA